jgi:uncharacterized protein YceK
MATLAGGTQPDKFDCSNDVVIPRVYSGVANDIRFLTGNYGDKGFVFWDLPFSLIADTLVLPYTLYSQIRYGNLCGGRADGKQS